MNTQDVARSRASLDTPRHVASSLCRSSGPEGLETGEVTQLLVRSTSGKAARVFGSGPY